MKPTWVLAMLVAALAACDRTGSEPDATASPAAAPDKHDGEPRINPPPAGVGARDDLSKPYLSEVRVEKLLESMGEAQCPLKYMFTDTGAMRSLEDLQEKWKEFDAFARKYGFQDRDDYMYTWGRIEAARISESGARTMRQEAEDRIRRLEEQLRAPDLSEDARRTGQTQLDGARRDLVEIRRRETGGLNEADAELVRRYGAQFDEALRRYRRNP